MSYDVILIMTPPWEPKRPPLGLAYISEYLRSRGFSPKVLDFNLSLFKKAEPHKRFFWEISNINSMSVQEISSKMFESFRGEIDALVEYVVSLDCNLIGFSVNIASLACTAKIATLIKEKDKNKIIIFGGTGCFWEHDRCLIFPEDMKSIDLLVIGDGEEPLEKIITNYKNGKTFKDIEGVIYKKKDFLKPSIPFYALDLDKLPFPTFSDFEIDSYKEGSVPMLISRGCIGRCTFCIDFLMCGRYRFRSPEKVFQEIKYHIEVNKTAHFAFNDLICNGNLKQLEKICDLIIEAKFKIIWGSYAMVRSDMGLKLLRKMQESGCIWLCYGMESGCDRTLKRMNKFYLSEDAENIIKATHEAGIQAALNLIVGFPGETEKDLEDTLSFVKRNKDYISEVTNVSSFVIMLASKIGKNPRDYGIKLPPSGTDLNLYRDENKLDLLGRLKRVRRVIFLIYNLGIRNVIINQPGSSDYGDRDTIALALCPRVSTELPPIRLANLYTFMQNNDRRPFMYDFNIALYRSAPSNLKYLWDIQNWHMWTFKEGISRIFDLLEKELFACIEDLISSKTNAFCFLIEGENFMFSLKIASILREYIPSIVTVFSGSVLEREDIRRLIPKDLVDIIIFREEESAILEILTSDRQCQSLQSTTVYNAINSRDKKNLTDFSGFDINRYDSPKLQLRFLS